MSVFLLTLKGVFKTSQLMRLGKYDWTSDWITDEHFPIQKHVPLDREIELFDFNHNSTDDEVLKELHLRNLERPTFEDALYFGIKYPEEQRKHPIVFLHQPVRGPNGHFRVLVLYGGNNYRYLYLGWFGDRWGCHCVFAGVRKQPL